VFRILKIHLSEHTIGDDIARLSASKALRAPQPMPEEVIAKLNAQVNARKAFSEPKPDPWEIVSSAARALPES
jgi:hypothetical protein